LPCAELSPAKKPTTFKVLLLDTTTSKFAGTGTVGEVNAALWAIFEFDFVTEAAVLTLMFFDVISVLISVLLPSGRIS
jgi:hypothetical protein